MAEARIVIIEDEPQVRAMVSEVLDAAGFETIGAADGLAGLRLVRELRPDLVLLDIGLPGGLTGTSVCREIRADTEVGQVAIVALTGQVGDKYEEEMFDAGADDYVRKNSFRPNLLVSRIRAVLRRTHGRSEEAIESDHLRIHPARREVEVAGKSISLTPTEFDILYRIASNPDRALPRRDLLDRGAGAAAVDRTVDVHVLSIRRKLGRFQWLIATVWGVGYRLGSAPED